MGWGAGPVFLHHQSVLYKDIQNPSKFGFNMRANLRIYPYGYYERFYVGISPRINFLDNKKYYDITFGNAGYLCKTSSQQRWRLAVGIFQGRYVILEVSPDSYRD